MMLLLLIWMQSHEPVLFPPHRDRREMIWLRRFFAESSSIEASSRKSTRKDSSSSTKKLKHSSRKKPHTSSVDRNASFSLGLQRLAQCNIISSRMDMSAKESEHRGLDMALMDDPSPRKKAKLEEQMTVIEAELTKLKSELNNMVATPPRSNLRSSPPHYNYDDIDSM